MLALKGFLLKVKHWFSSPFPGYSTTKSVHESLKLKKKYAKRLAKHLLFMTNSTFPNFPSDPASPLTHFRICAHPRTSIDDILSIQAHKFMPKAPTTAALKKGEATKKVNIMATICLRTIYASAESEDGDFNEAVVQPPNPTLPRCRGAWRNCGEKKGAKINGTFS